MHCMYAHILLHKCTQWYVFQMLMNACHYLNIFMKIFPNKLLFFYIFMEPDVKTLIARTLARHCQARRLLPRWQPRVVPRLAMCRWVVREGDYGTGGGLRIMSWSHT